MAARRLVLLALCRSLPGVTEEVKWTGDVVFSVGRKMFATFDADGHDAQFGCRVPESDFAAVTSVDGIRPARFGGARLSWIRVVDPKVLLASEAAALIRASYDVVRLTLPPEERRAIRGPVARAQIPRRLARARPKVEVPGKKPSSSSSWAPSSAEATPPSTRKKTKKDESGKKPIAPSPPRVPARAARGGRAPLPLRVPVAKTDR